MICVLLSKGADISQDRTTTADSRYLSYLTALHATYLGKIFRQHFFKVLVQIPYSQHITGGHSIES
jgi:hypothetical protein